MQKIVVHKFEIQSTRTTLNGAIAALEQLFDKLESGAIPEDLELSKQLSINRLKNRVKDLLEIEQAACSLTTESNTSDVLRIHQSR